jgi:hypothetical protein
MRMGWASRRALRRIGAELRREDPLLAAMLSENDKVPSEGQHPENGKARRRQAGDAALLRSRYTPFVMF